MISVAKFAHETQEICQKHFSPLRQNQTQTSSESILTSGSQQQGGRNPFPTHMDHFIFGIHDLSPVEVHH